MSASMLSLPVVAIADLASPAELFRCAHFHDAILSAGACLSRQAARKTVRTGSGGKVHQKEIVPEAYKYCASGECAQGAGVKARLADYVPPPSARARMAERRRAQGVAEVSQIEQQIAAKVASGELRPKESAHAASEEAGSNDPVKRSNSDARAIALADQGAGELVGVSEEEETVADKVCKTQDCTKPLRSDNESGYCTRHLNAHRGREARAALAKQRPAPPPPTHATPVVYGGLLQAQPADLIELLEQRRAHHLAEAERCGLALRALKGTG